VYVFGQAANAEILGDGHKRFTWREALRPLEAVDGPTALPLTDGEDHDRRRRLVQPAFATRRIDAAVPLIVAEVDKVINGLRVGDTVDLYALYRAAVRRIVVRVLFGSALAENSDRLGEVLEPAMRFVDRPLQLQFKGAPGWRRARRARHEADAIVDTEVARRRSHDDAGTDVLGMLLDTGLSDAELRDQVVSLIAAGYDTTSAAVAWAVLELLRHPVEWEALKAQVLARLGLDGRAPDADDLREMPYGRAVVNETLRLWPPASLSGRRAAEAFTVDGHQIPAGSIVVFSPFVTGRSAALWGDDADAFRPGRWLEQPEPPTFSFIPFGGTHRRCLGFALALTEIQVAVTRLVQRTRLTLLPQASIRGTGLSALHPERGVAVRIDSVA
jgi:cytochrome P450